MKYIEENGKLLIDLKENNKKEIIKNTKKILKKCDQNDLVVVLLDNNKKIEKLEDEDIDTILKIFKAINIKDTYERYNYIYDEVCDYLDKKIIEYNLCDFDENSVCKYYREYDNTHYNGCCYREDRGLCKYFDEEEKRCVDKGISCKFYLCPAIRKTGFVFRQKDIPLIRYFFNIKQKFIIRYSILKPKLYVLYKLMEKK